ncbi:MAG: glycosyltransferase family 2 protein [Oscillospiraceae bacterium]|nr:glycosyltransferase family 2 protein [Oscillospiraceae bacterium]
METLVSVLIVTYNYGRFLSECLDSVLQQKFDGAMEIIVVDDGSTDDTRQIAERYPVRYFYQDHKGIAAARNLALSKAKGEWVAFIDADDLWTADKLDLQLKKAAEHPGCEVVFCPVKNCNINEKAILMQKAQGGALTEDVVHFLIPALIRRDLLLRLGGFPEDMERGEDTYILAKMRMERLNCDVCIDKVCYLRRVHGDNITLQNDKAVSVDTIVSKILRERILARKKEQKS